MRFVNIVNDGHLLMGLSLLVELGSVLGCRFSIVLGGVVVRDRARHLVGSDRLALDLELSTTLLLMVLELLLVVVLSDLLVAVGCLLLFLHRRLLLLHHLLVMFVARVFIG